MIFIYISLTISSNKQTEIKLIAFIASMIESKARDRRNKDWELLIINLSHISIATYLLIPCEHILS